MKKQEEEKVDGGGVLTGIISLIVLGIGLYFMFR